MLIVGPNPTFLRYISQVLPSLAETGVLLRTLGDLYPGRDRRAAEAPAAAALKGRPAMVEVLAARGRATGRRCPTTSVEVDLDGYTAALDRATLRGARERARRTGRPHNLARPIFVDRDRPRASLQVAERIGADPLGGDEPARRGRPGRDPRASCARTPAVQAALDGLWPVLTPQQLLRGPVQRPPTGWRRRGRADRRRAGAAAARAAGAGWTPADVPLLDEAAELLGEDDATGCARPAAPDRRERSSTPRACWRSLAAPRSIDFEDEEDRRSSRASDLLDASGFAERHASDDAPDRRRAGGGRPELGVRARHRGRGAGAVADGLAAADAPLPEPVDDGGRRRRADRRAGRHRRPGSRCFEPYVADRWRLAELTVNYRTPAEIMAVAADVLAAIDPALQPPRSVRSTGVRAVGAGSPPARSPRDVGVRREAAEVGDGRVGRARSRPPERELGPALRRRAAVGRGGSSRDLDAARWCC